MNHKRKTKLWTVLLIALALISAFVLSGVFSSPKFYARTLQTIEEQKQDAMALNVAVTAASTMLSTLPDDVASPIANELADLSLPLFLIVSVLYLEKFLLTTFGFVAFAAVVPLACILTAVYLHRRGDELLTWIRKLIILAAALVMIIPLSAGLTRQVKETFSESVDQTLEQAFSLAGAEAEADEEETNAIVSFFSGLKDNVSSLVSAAKGMLSVLVDAVAVMLITGCVIPVLTAFAFAWCVKILMDTDVPIKNLAMLVRPSRRRMRGRRDSGGRKAIAGGDAESAGEQPGEDAEDAEE